MTNNIREEWEAKKAERANQPEVLPAEVNQISVSDLRDLFNFRPRPDQASWWEYCQDHGMTFEQAIEPLLGQRPIPGSKPNQAPQLIPRR